MIVFVRFRAARLLCCGDVPRFRTMNCYRFSCAGEVAKVDLAELLVRLALVELLFNPSPSLNRILQIFGEMLLVGLAVRMQHLDEGADGFQDRSLVALVITLA